MRYTFIQQHDATDCAAACLAMVCLHYGKETTITKLRDVMGTDITGTNLLNLSRCAESLGFTSQAVRVDREGFLSKFTLPAIAHIITKDGYSHFVVVFKISKKYVVIGDPAKDLMRMRTDEFLNMFTGAMLIVLPNEKFVTGHKEGMKMHERYLKLLLPQKKLFAYGILASFLITILGILTSIVNTVIYDEILPYRQKDALQLIILAFAGMTVTQIILGFIREWIMLHLSLKIDIPLMLGYFEHIYSLPMRFFATRRTGDIITRFSDAFMIKNVFTKIALTLVMDVSMAFVTGTILFQLNERLFGIVLYMTVISAFLILIFKEPYKKINEAQMQQSSKLSSQIIEGLQAVETIKGNANEQTELERIEREYIKSLRINYKENMLSNIQGKILDIVSNGGKIILLYYGIMQVIQQDITLGSMMAFTTLSEYFTKPLNNLVKLQLSIQEAGISMKRLSEILEYESEQSKEEKARCHKVENIVGDIIFKNVTFSYGNRKPVLNKLSFTIPKGKKVAIVGASGSGKSTIAKLLLKNYEPEEGEITIDGMNIREMENESLRRSISYVPQNIELFSRSIYDNIRVSRIDATPDEVKAAAKAADAHGFIQKLPLQYETCLEEAGNGLSGGEKQRIALARAFLKENEFYIMDESTSNLDFTAESIIFDMIYNTYKDKTMLIIAHRLATIKNCDHIIVLEHGQILEQGSHEELLEKQGRYYELWELQQGNFKK